MSQKILFSDGFHLCYGKGRAVIIMRANRAGCGKLYITCDEVITQKMIEIDCI